MKNLFFTSFFAVFIVLIPKLPFAQSPVLTNQMISPIIGESYTFFEVDTTFVGAAGENQVWDFSNLQTVDDAPWMYISLEQTMHGQYFPGANVASADENMCMFEFYQKSAERLTYVGIYMDGLIMYFDDYKDALHYPFAYGDTLYDTFSTQYEQSTAMHHRQGTVQAQADAYGTLILPWGTLDDVLRVKTIEQMTDTFTFNNIPFEYNYYDEIYAYYKLGIREPVLEFKYSSVNGNDLELTGHYINETEANAVAEINHEGTLKLFPNPVNNQLNIKTIATNPIQYCSITNVDGKIIWEDNQLVLPGTKILDVSFLDSGVYFINIQAGKQKMVKKFIKE